MGKYKSSEDKQQMNNVLKYQDDQLKELLVESRKTRSETDAEIETLEAKLRALVQRIFNKYPIYNH